MSERRTAAPLPKGTAAQHTKNPSHEVPCQSTGLDHADALARVDDAFITVVRTKTGHIRRTAFFSLEAAERAVLRSWDRGLPAEVVVCRLTALHIGGSL